ncbi:hypothetical protein GCM10010412_068200 [Nonomuraea recticatena]|uniref:Uncharacterized protein n=1 Tax=Nonomuraea recticatena TaxID=46178 RepID=A0ABP6F398_9ACTN
MGASSLIREKPLKGSAISAGSIRLTVSIVASRDRKEDLVIESNVRPRVPQGKEGRRRGMERRRRRAPLPRHRGAGRRAGRPA